MATTAESTTAQVVVSAASSLEPAFTAYADAAGIDAKQSFAGSDDLAAQIRQGVKPDVYAAANTSLPEDLFADGLVERAGRLRHQHARARRAGGLRDRFARRPGRAGTSSWRSATRASRSATTRARCSPGCPAGRGEAILANVRSLEPDVAGIVGKLTQGAVDAGFVYVTDVVATDGELEAIELPAELQPDVAYGAAVVEGAENPDGRRRRSSTACSTATGAEALAEAGFGPPPE